MVQTDCGDVPVVHEADVVIVGGGPAGVCAAVAAAEEGADTLLVERYGFLGGMATAGLVNPFMPYRAGSEQVNAGAFQRMIDWFEELGGWSHRSNAPTAFDPEVAKLALDLMVQQAGVRLLLHSYLVGAESAGGRVQKVVTAGKSGLQGIAGMVFIDASGDADLAALAGARYELGRPEDGFCQPMTMNFRMAGVDEDRLPSRETITELFLAAKARGEIDNPRENCLWFFTTRPGEIHFNTTRVVKLDATRTEDMTAAELEGRKQVREMVRFLTTRVAGFEHGGFVVALAAVVETEEVDLVVAAHLLALGRVGERGVGHVLGIVGGHGHGAAHHPEFQVARSVAEKVLHPAQAGGLGQHQLVGVFFAHEAEVLGQNHELGPFGGGQAHQAQGFTEVGVQAAARDHLNGGDFHGGTGVGKDG